MANVVSSFVQTPPTLSRHGFPKTWWLGHPLREDADDVSPEVNLVASCVWFWHRPPMQGKHMTFPKPHEHQEAQRILFPSVHSLLFMPLDMS